MDNNNSDCKDFPYKMEEWILKDKWFNEEMDEIG